MTGQFLGQVKMFAGSRVPRFWARADGSVLPISENAALFSLIKTTYGGNGKTSFALPDMRGRAPVHYGHGPGLRNWTLGESFGTEEVALSVTQMPEHTHGLNAAYTVASSTSPAGRLPGYLYRGSSDPNNPPTTEKQPTFYKVADPPFRSMAQMAIGTGGKGQAHNNMMPYLSISFMIYLI